MLLFHHNHLLKEQINMPHACLLNILYHIFRCYNSFMNILAIETSCDETAVAIIKDGTKILSNVVVSQVDIFAAYGGVIPEVAARSHLEAMMPVLHQAFKDAGFVTPDGQDDWSQIDAIAVTHTPGLLGSLLIGTLTARTLAILHDKPLYPVHHLKSHIYANWLGEGQTPQFPLLALVVSGGHTQIIYMKGHNQFEIIGTTRDDAVGECFDKVAKILGLPYPGGPSITEAAKNGDPCKYKLPKPHVEGLDFSFSGLKTAVLRAVQKECGLPISHPSHDLKNHLTKQQIADFAASFQATAVDILLDKLQKALEQHPDVKSIALAGGVSANVALREKAKKAIFPPLEFTGDNAAMVGAAAFYEIKSGVKPVDPFKLDIYPRSDISKS